MAQASWPGSIALEMAEAVQESIESGELPGVVLQVEQAGEKGNIAGSAQVAKGPGLAELVDQHHGKRHKPGGLAAPIPFGWCHQDSTNSRRRRGRARTAIAQQSISWGTIGPRL